MAGSTLVCGPEGLSVRVAEALMRLGERVIIIADSPDARLVRDAKAAGVRLLAGRAAELAHRYATALHSARCLVLTENSDLGNLNAALAARDVNPDLRLVIRMFDADLAHRTTRMLANSRVISTSYESAPHFAAAALGLASAPTRLVWGRHVSSEPQPPPAGANGHSTRRSLLGLRPVGTTRTPAERPVELGQGQFLTPIEPPPRPRRRRGLHRLRGFRRALRAFFDRRLAVSIAAISLLIAVSATVFHATLRTPDGSGVSWFDALYFTVTAFTAGNNDYGLLGTPWWVKLYAAGFVLAAALSLAVFYALAADAVLGTRILEALGEPRGRRRDHVVVIGVGSIGYRIIQHLLDYGVEVVGAQISGTSQWVRLARRLGVPVLIGDGRYRDSLGVLSVDRASAVIAATNDDLANLEVALTARELNPDARIVVRLVEPELARRVHDQLALDVCLSVSSLATPAFVAASVGDGVLSTIEHGDRLWLLAELTVQPGSPLDGMAIPSLEASGGLSVLAVRDDEAEYWRPECPERLTARNAVLVACSRDRWDGLQELSTGATALASASGSGAGQAPDPSSGS